MPRATPAVKPPKAAKKAKVNGYQMAVPLPKGQIVEDLAKKQWKLGPSIGKGGFGEIYSAKEASNKSSSYPYVIKIEPHANGPLFVERNFYVQNAKPEDVENFKTQHKLKTFGMPVYWGSGSHDYDGEKLRFIVMDKFGSDLDKLLKENKGSFPAETVFKVALQMVHVLEYIHNLGYVHADLKGANILLGIKAGLKNQAYLVDFGLAAKFSTAKEFKPNPKKAHDGTIEYLSRDAHHGVATRRGDLEILAYNLIHWLGGKLPWQSRLEDPKIVHSMKDQAFEDISKFLQTSLGNKVPAALRKFVEYVGDLKFNETPNYKKIQNWFIDGIKAAGGTVDGPLKFNDRKRKSVSKDDVVTPEKIPKAETGRLAKRSESYDVDEEPELYNGEPINDGIKEVLSKREKTKKKTAVKKKKETVSVDAVEETMTPAMLAVINRKKETQKTKQTRKPKVTASSQNDHVDSEDEEVVMKKSKSSGTSNGKKEEKSQKTEQTRKQKALASSQNGHVDSEDEEVVLKKSKSAKTSNGEARVTRSRAR